MKEQPQQQQQQPRREVEVRARKQERVWMVLAIVFGLVLVALFLMDYLKFNPWVLIFAGIAILILLLVLLRETPPPDMWDAWRKIRKKEYKESYTPLPVRPRNLQVQPYGRYWLLQAFVPESSVIATYFWEVQPGRVVGRRIRPIDDLTRMMDKSKIATLGAQEAIMKYERNRLVESMGFEPDVEESQ